MMTSELLGVHPPTLFMFGEGDEIAEGLGAATSYGSALEANGVDTKTISGFYSHGMAPPGMVEEVTSWIWNHGWSYDYEWA